ncbi:MAG: ATP synthase F1 subunit epsilon [Candidatus Moraniibacteriota bacterium]
MKTLKLKVVTPERSVTEIEATSVMLPIEDGEVTILPDHEPYIGSLKAGEILFRRGGEDEKGSAESLAVSGGFVEFCENTLTVLADTAERAEEIDLSRAEEARKRAEQLMKERTVMSEEEYAFVAAALEKEWARIKVARKHRSHGGLPSISSE